LTLVSAAVITQPEEPTFPVIHRRTGGSSRRIQHHPPVEITEVEMWLIGVNDQDYTGPRVGGTAVYSTDENEPKLKVSASVIGSAPISESSIAVVVEAVRRRVLKDESNIIVEVVGFSRPETKPDSEITIVVERDETLGETTKKSIWTLIKK
jgi:hypothetical protein